MTGTAPDTGDSQEVDDGGEESDSVISDALRALKDKENAPPHKELTAEEKAAAEAAAKKADTYDKDLPDLDDKHVNPKVGEKFKRLKTEAITKLREKDVALAAAEAKVKELEAKAPSGALTPEEFDKHPEVVKLKKALQEQSDLIERKWLEESPTFKAQYQDKIDAENKKIITTLKGVSDEKTRMAIATAIDTIARIPLTEEGDNQFDAELSKLIERSGLNLLSANKILTGMQEARKFMHEREAKVGNWKEASKGIQSEEQQQRATTAKAALTAVEQIRSNYHNTIAAKLAVYRKNEKAFAYDTITGPLLEKAKAALAKSAETGSLTPDVVALTHAGVEMPFYVNLSENLQNLLVNKSKRVAELEAELEKVRGKDPSKGSRDRNKRQENLDESKKGDEDEDGESRSVLGAAIRRKMRAA